MNDQILLDDAARMLMSTDFESALPDTPTVIDSAVVVEPDEGGLYLDVWGWVAPQIRFALRLPRPGSWNGRSLFVGSGGPGGFVNPAELTRGAQLGFATVTTDTGHAATGAGSVWSWGNPDAYADWAWRCVHAAAEASQEIIRRVYGRSADRRYYVGVSTAGRHGLMEAQRYPGDFDGILANNSGHNYMYATFTWPWLAQQVYEDDGTPIIELADMPVIRDAVLNQASAVGAVDDGVIRRPHLVDVDASQIRVSAAKQEVLHRIYHGPADQPGERGFRGLLAGSEAHGDWEFLFAGSTHLWHMARGLIRYQIYDEAPGPTAEVSSWQAAHWPDAFGVTHEMCNALDPDIDEFRARGGKLMMTQSWGDGWVDPHHALWYWNDVVDRYGADAADAVRLFMVPGRGHGSGLFHYGPTADTLDLLVRWVEEDLAPDELVVDDVALQAEAPVAARAGVQ